jgi:hypothetical protein
MKLSSTFQKSIIGVCALSSIAIASLMSPLPAWAGLARTDKTDDAVVRGISAEVPNAAGTHTDQLIEQLEQSTNTRVLRHALVRTVAIKLVLWDVLPQPRCGIRLVPTTARRASLTREVAQLQQQVRFEAAALPFELRAKVLLTDQTLSARQYPDGFELPLSTAIYDEVHTIKDLMREDDWAASNRQQGKTDSAVAKARPPAKSDYRCAGL